MTWRRLKLALFAILLLVGLARLMLGNLIGGILTLALAVVVGGWAFDVPLLKRARQLLRLLRASGSKKKTKDED